MADARLLLITHLLAAGAGFAVAPRELLESAVVHNGFFETDTKRVLAAAVESLRAENKLLVYSYRGFAAVSVERDGLLVLNGRQDLIVPATVSYYVDLSALTLDMLAYDERTRVVTVMLPPLVMGEVSFQPEAALSRSEGLLTFSQAQVDEFSRINYANARRAFIKQAQGATLIKAAEEQAKDNIARQFKMPLRIAGRPDVRVVASFVR